MLYVFKNKETGEITEEIMTLKEREDYLKEHPELEPAIVSAPPVAFKGSGWMTKKGYVG